MKGTLEVSKRTFRERFREHLKLPLPTYHHQSTSGHIASVEDFNIVGREGCSFARTIKESIFTRVNNATHNKDIGKYSLPHIWDRVLFHTSN